MNKITTNSKSWSPIDELDGVKLKAGEELKIEWPNGRITKELVFINETSVSISDHGHSYDYPRSRAYVVASINGTKVSIYISGLRASRIEK